MTLELDRPEARVQTRLVDRRRRKVALPPVSGALFVVGPYSVTEGLVRAPGAWIVRAVDPNGEEVLLQLVHLRPLANEAERAMRMQVEQRVLARTTELLDEIDRVVLAHGGVDRIDGTRLLFWAMPLPEKVTRLGNPLAHLRTLDDLLSFGVDIAKRMARRHEIGRFEPLLSEHLLLAGDRGAELIGVPVQVPVEWLAAEMPAPRFAPEEAANGVSTALGDVWRLGQALSVLACAFEPLPPEVRALFDRMTAHAPASRQPRASEVVVELEAVRRALDGASTRAPESQTVAMTLALKPDAVTELMMRAMGESSEIDASVPMLVPDAPVPAWAFFFEPEDYRLFEATMEELAPRGLSDLDRAELARLCRGQPSDRWALLMRTYLSIDVDTLFGSAHAEATIAEVPRSIETDPVETIVDTALDPIDVAETRMVAPLVYAPEPIPQPLGREEVSVEVFAPSIEPSKEDDEPAPLRSRRRWVLGSLGGLALLGAAALAAGRPGDAALMVDLDRRVVIETGTKDASILGEDGTVLGAGPVAIAVPHEGELAVLVAAPGHRPERIVLPSGGALKVSLAPLPEHPETCTLEVPRGVTVEGIGAVLDGPIVRGAAVVRAKEGNASRATIVRCDGSLRIERPQEVQVGLTVDSKRTEVRAGFHRVTSKGRELWVPVHRPLEIVR